MKPNTIITAVVSALLGASMTLALMAPAIASEPADLLDPETFMNCAELETEVYQAHLELRQPTTEAPKVKKPDTTLDPEEIELIARTIWGEAEGVPTNAERAAVAWCILNRVDAWGKAIEDVVTAPGQFYGYYRVKGEVPEHFRRLAADVLNRWNMEKKGAKDVGRVLPKDYLYFIGDGHQNHFTKAYKSTAYWDWSLPSPYNYQT